jgi:hypothetical protein
MQDTEPGDLATRARPVASSLSESADVSALCQTLSSRYSGARGPGRCPAGFVFLATAMIVDADRSGRQSVGIDQPGEAAAQDGSRPMNPIS